ncbi:MAG: acetolactate synthase small subunit, partial [Desulfobacterales bacterium]|nr:acetolactate synthase small subunit [Desulfobacterales bacterium]
SRVEGISRMTITLREDNIAKVTQVIKQLEKFTEVISVKELDTDKSYWREAAIVKLEVDSDHLHKFNGRYNFEVLEQKSEDIQIIQVAGSTKQIDTFLDEVGREHIIEIARTGVTAMEK